MTENDLIKAVLESKRVADDLFNLFDFEEDADNQWAMLFVASIKELGFDFTEKRPGGRDG